MDYNNMKAKDLMKIAKGTGIRRYCDLKNAALIKALDLNGLTRKERHKSKCEHGLGYYCRKCGGSGLCEHDRRKCLCKEWWISNVCTQASEIPMS